MLLWYAITSMLVSMLPIGSPTEVGTTVGDPTSPTSSHNVTKLPAPPITQEVTYFWSEQARRVFVAVKITLLPACYRPYFKMFEKSTNGQSHSSDSYLLAQDQQAEAF